MPALNKAFSAPKMLLISAAALVAGLSGCASQGPTDDPVARHFSWEYYVGGDDIARSCAPGSPDRYRMVYNAIYDEQRRSYDFTPLDEAGQDKGAMMLEARAMAPANLVTIKLNDPIGPWRGAASLRKLTAAEFAGIKAGLEQAGFSKPAPKGMFLRGDDFYWTASACINGAFHFHAWNNEQPGFAALPFLALLAPFDATGVEPNPPRAVALLPYGSWPGQTQDSMRPQPHRFRVGDNGLDYGRALRI
ncbi:hypothetical protein [Ferrovibrio sp.]|uniref:hypothetical protein n=1 Tax=Ferrovibrio sp. TaxID=1917215 RepID=UPI0025C25C6B|nr:hypothetical protein [Ferrovibrio sp.]MBX3456640.1 hypothetical protein [Ferrovibrio sp.]